jgi:transposase
MSAGGEKNSKNKAPDAAKMVRVGRPTILDPLLIEEIGRAVEEGVHPTSVGVSSRSVCRWRAHGRRELAALSPAARLELRLREAEARAQALSWEATAHLLDDLARDDNDISELLPLVDAIPPVRGKRGRPRRRPRRLYGDRAYDSRRHRRELRARGIAAAIPRPKQQHGSGLGKQRWVVERTISWLHQYRRLRVRYERRADIHQAFLQIAGCLICLKLLNAEESF